MSGSEISAPAQPCSQKGLPDRCITAAAGGLLHHLFTLTLAGGMFLWPWTAGCPAPGFPRRHAHWSADFPQLIQLRLPSQPSFNTI